MQTLEDRILGQKWFYKFVLPSGAVTQTHTAEHILKIHDTRSQMLFQELEDGMGIDYPNTTFIDFASHEGYFSNQIASRGAKKVLGLEARLESVNKANLVNELFDYSNLNFEQADVSDANAIASVSPADVVLVFGLIYHVENPIGILRNAIGLATRAVIVETQVVPNMSGNIDWGASEYYKDLKGVFGIIDESEEIDNNTEASVTGICLAPSIEGLAWILKAAGCRSVKLLEPPNDGYEQLVKKRRVMMIGYK